MKKFAFVLLCFALTGCTTYSHIEKISDNEYYLVKNYHVLGFTEGAVELCKADHRNHLDCDGRVD